MKKIVIFNQKGGTGKTTISVNLSGVLDLNMKKKVLVVDCDPQCNSSNYLLTTKGEIAEWDIYDLLSYNKNIEEVIEQIPLTLGKQTKLSNIWLLSGNENIDSLEIEDYSILKNKLSEIENKFDYCIFDCPPHLNTVTLMSLIATDYVLVPALADTDSLGGYNKLMDTINNIRQSGLNLKILILGIIFNNVEINKSLESFIINSCSSNMTPMIFDTRIKRSSVIPQARFYGKPISYYKGNCNSTKDFINLAKEINKRIKQMGGK